MAKATEQDFDSLRSEMRVLRDEAYRTRIELAALRGYVEGALGLPFESAVRVGLADSAAGRAVPHDTIVADIAGRRAAMARDAA